MILYFGITMIIAVCIYYTIGIKEREGLKNNPDQDNIDNYMKQENALLEDIEELDCKDNKCNIISSKKGSNRYFNNTYGWVEDDKFNKESYDGTVWTPKRESYLPESSNLNKLVNRLDNIYNIDSELEDSKNKIKSRVIWKNTMENNNEITGLRNTNIGLQKNIELLNSKETLTIQEENMLDELTEQLEANKTSIDQLEIDNKINKTANELLKNELIKLKDINDVPENLSYEEGEIVTPAQFGLKPPKSSFIEPTLDKNVIKNMTEKTNDVNPYSDTSLKINEF